VPGSAAELAVGGRAEADLFLLADDLPDRLVFDAAKLVGVDPAGVEIVARLQKVGGAKQAADVIGAERGFRACADDLPSSVVSVQRSKKPVAASPCRRTSKR
jgi:hypothetical protein